MTAAGAGRDRRALLAEVGLVGIAAVWGLTFVMVQDAIALLPPLAFLAYRFLAAGILMTTLSVPSLRRLPASGFIAGGVLGFCLAAGFVFQTFGLARTSVSNAGFITGLVVVLTPVLGALFFGEKVAFPTWIAAVVSALGLYLLSGGASRFSLGDLLVLGGAVAFSFHLLVSGRVMSRYDTMALVAVQLLVCGLACLGGAALRHELAMPRGSTVWSALVVTTLFASALGFFVQAYAQRHAPPTRTALILASEPVFTGFFGYWLKDERLTAAAWLGAGLILIAIVGVEVERARLARRAA